MGMIINEVIRTFIIIFIFDLNNILKSSNKNKIFNILLLL